MKLEIAQAILEEARFAHVGKFLEREATPGPEQHLVNLEINLLDVVDPEQAVVKLTVRSHTEPQYSFNASYLLLFKVEPEEGDPTGEELKLALATTGATMLMPMLRECIANLTMRGRFGALWLPPVRFAGGQLQTPDEAQTAQPDQRRPRKRKTATKR